MNCSPLASSVLSRHLIGRFVRSISILLTIAMTLLGVARADDTTQRHKTGVYSSKTGGVLRQYTKDERVRYQLWDYKWSPNPNLPITRVEVRIGEQKVYIFQGDQLAGESPTTTGKPGHDTPPGHYTVLAKDIDHKSNLYGVLLDAQGYIVSADAKAGDTAPAGMVYDAADMPYYLRIREDGTGLHAGYLPGYPASHGCIRLPHAFAELLFSNISEGTPVDVVP